MIGCGLMGSGIAEVCARAGLDVVVKEYDADAAERGLGRLTGSLDTAVRRGKLDESERDATLARIGFTTDLDELGDRQLVIEAVNEDESTKIDTFRALDKVFADHGDDLILASNTSSIPIMKLAMATSRPEHVIGLHFFNPVPVLPLLEVVTSLLTSDRTTATSTAFASEVLGKRVIPVGGLSEAAPVCAPLAPLS